ncbi:MAG: amino acid permease [Gemmatimonadetes bacterium]|nr:amino acid permease [Gemmatimonadota bacterium]MBP6669387.1 amino acid permease [Gemmatimonadales bacterium]MBK6781064.1 amino acid permease [Gemmatimonadota bacterium]MBK7351398.1 amino acid permease [Gemmatimonadota bacterium]MBK7716090.1 amino acid permease [Gemmatimonadota bacterium]
MDAAPPSPDLKRSLGLRDLVLFNVVAVLSIRWLATSAANGVGALTLWVGAALLFFVPMGLATVELATRFPEEGGIYFWTKRAFGPGHGFLCGWCYWVNNLLYYPSLLLATATIGTYALGEAGVPLQTAWGYLLPATLVLLWLAALLNIVGVGTGKWLQNAGAVAAYLPGVLLVGLAAYVLATRGPANDFSLAALVPRAGKLSDLSLWASIAFAFTGIELCAVMAGEVKDPARTLKRAILVAAPLIAGIYIVGTAAMLILVPAGEINIVSGLLQGIERGVGHAGPLLGILVPAAAISVVLGNLGQVGAWLIGPARIAFMIGLDRYFPPAFGKVHPRWGTPYVAILVEAGVATVLLVVAVMGKGSTVEKAYLVMLDTMILIYFIPFLYLFLSYVKFTGAEPSPTARGPRRWFVGASGIGLTLFGMGLSMVPPAEGSVLAFEAKVVGGALAFVVLGLWLYWRKR